MKKSEMKFGVDDIVRYKITGERGQGRVMCANVKNKTYTLRTLSSVIVVDEKDLELVKKHVSKRNRL